MDLNVLEDMRDSLSEMRRQRDELAEILQTVLDKKGGRWHPTDPIAMRARAALEKIK